MSTTSTIQAAAERRCLASCPGVAADLAGVPPVAGWDRLRNVVAGSRR